MKKRRLCKGERKLFAFSVLTAVLALLLACVVPGCEDPNQVKTSYMQLELAPLVPYIAHTEAQKRAIVLPVPESDGTLGLRVIEVAGPSSDPYAVCLKYLLKIRKEDQVLHALRVKQELTERRARALFEEASRLLDVAEDLEEARKAWLKSLPYLNNSIVPRDRLARQSESPVLQPASRPASQPVSQPSTRALLLPGEPTWLTDIVEE